MKRNGKAMSFIRVGMGLAAVVFIGMYLRATWGKLSLSPSTFGWNYLGLSCIILAAGYGINGLVWKLLLSAGEKKAGYFESLYMVSIAMLMRYIPGKIWQLAGRYSMACDRGFNKGTVVVSLVEESAADLSAAMLIAYAAFGRRMGWAGVLFIGALAIAAGVLSQKSIRTRLPIPDVSAGRIATAAVLCTVNWIGYGFAFYCAIRALGVIDLRNVVLCGGALAIGWVGGMASFFTPNGMGVREGIVALLLTPVVSAPQAVAAALVFRFASAAVELALGGSLYYVNRILVRRRAGETSA
jgi:hypothetical protein